MGVISNKLKYNASPSRHVKDSLQRRTKNKKNANEEIDPKLKQGLKGYNKRYCNRKGVRRYRPSVVL